MCIVLSTVGDVLLYTFTILVINVIVVDAWQLLCTRLNFNLLGNFQICFFPFPSNDFKELTFLSSISILLFFFSKSCFVYCLAKKICKTDFYPAALTSTFFNAAKSIWVQIHLRNHIFSFFRLAYNLFAEALNKNKYFPLHTIRWCLHEGIYSAECCLYRIDKYCLYYICANV